MNPTASRVRAVAALVGALLFASLLGAPEADARPRQVDTAVDQLPAPNDRIEDLRFACQTDIVDGERGVLCRWSASSRDNVRGYQLYRIVNGSPRELVATIPTGQRLHAFDTDIEHGDHLVYGVVARNRGGRVIGIGGPVRLAIPS